MHASRVADDDDVGLRTIPSAAKFLGVSVSSLYELYRKGEIEMVKVGKKSTRVTQASLDKYIKTAKRVILARPSPLRRNRKGDDES